MKKTIRKVSSKKRVVRKSGSANLNSLLIENFVSLQKVLTELSGKFGGLAREISELLKIFELSARDLAKKETVPKQDVGEQKILINKLNTLLEQNKIIAQGLTLIHEKIPEQDSFSEVPEQIDFQNYKKSVPIKPSPPKGSSIPIESKKNLDREIPQFKKIV